MTTRHQHNSTGNIFSNLLPYTAALMALLFAAMWASVFYLALNLIEAVSVTFSEVYIVALVIVGIVGMITMLSEFTELEGHIWMLYGLGTFGVAVWYMLGTAAPVFMQYVIYVGVSFVTIGSALIYMFKTYK